MVKKIGYKNSMSEAGRPTYGDAALQALGQGAALASSYIAPEFRQSCTSVIDFMRSNLEHGTHFPAPLSRAVECLGEVSAPVSGDAGLLGLGAYHFTHYKPVQDFIHDYLPLPPIVQKVSDKVRETIDKSQSLKNIENVVVPTAWIWGSHLAARAAQILNAEPKLLMDAVDAGDTATIAGLAALGYAAINIGVRIAPKVAWAVKFTTNEIAREIKVASKKRRAKLDRSDSES